MQYPKLVSSPPSAEHIHLFRNDTKPACCTQKDGFAHYSLKAVLQAQTPRISRAHRDLTYTLYIKQWLCSVQPQGSVASTKDHIQEPTVTWISRLACSMSLTRTPTASAWPFSAAQCSPRRSSLSFTPMLLPRDSSLETTGA